jgi:hypothetical protein
MSEYRVNVETFRITNGEAPKLKVDRGFAVAEIGDHEATSLYLNPLAAPGRKDKDVPYRHREYNHIMKLDRRDSPEVGIDGTVNEFSTGPAIKLASAFELHKLLAYAPVELAVGRVALILLKEIDPRVYHARGAVLWNGNSLAKGILDYHNFEERAEGDPELRASLIVLSEHGSLELTDISGGEGIDRKLTYDPYSQEGLKVDPSLEPDEPEGPEDFDEGGSDRQPRNPLIPQASGEAEAEIPEREDNSASYKEVIS